MGKRDASKERYWRKLIRRQGKTDETVAGFCAREGVPVHQFYWWQRTLRTRERQSTSQRRVDDASTSPSELAGASFVPVRLPFVPQAPIELVHPGGCVVRVPPGFDPQSLRLILATLDPSTFDNAEN